MTAFAGRDGGRISIDPIAVVLQKSIINGLAAGLPVTVTVVADVFLSSPDSQILTDTPVDLPETDLTNGLIPYAALPLSVEEQLSERCTTAVPEGASSFIVSSKGGLAASPEQLQPFLLPVNDKTGADR